ncbi:GNAT family N-acetyltransferase [Streptomyces mirabilis]|uniref:GNAT family N-acetyltransferase n=1 Tax=Streptomyces mirabilis TaxID=68239 RepID=UPI0033AB54BF
MSRSNEEAREEAHGEACEKAREKEIATRPPDYSAPVTNQPLEGTVVRLVRLSPDHAEALFPSASDPEVWRWMPRARPETVVQLREWLGEMTADPTRRCFAVQRRDDGTLCDNLR